MRSPSATSRSIGSSAGASPYVLVSSMVSRAAVMTSSVPAARPASMNSRILTRHSSRLRTHQAIPATTMSSATTMRTTVPTSGCSRTATTASPATALMTSG